MQLGTSAWDLDIELPDGGQVTTRVPQEFQGFAYVLEGEGAFGANRRPVRPPQLVLLGQGDAFTVADAAPGTRYLLMAGQPYGEAPVFNGPFVDLPSGSGSDGASTSSRCSPRWDARRIELVGERQHPHVPERDMAEHAGDRPIARSREREARPRPGARPGREGARALGRSDRRTSDPPTCRNDDTAGGWRPNTSPPLEPRGSWWWPPEQWPGVYGRHWLLAAIGSATTGPWGRVET